MLTFDLDDLKHPIPSHPPTVSPVNWVVWSSVARMITQRKDSQRRSTQTDLCWAWVSFENEGKWIIQRTCRKCSGLRCWWGIWEQKQPLNLKFQLSFDSWSASFNLACSFVNLIGLLRIIAWKGNQWTACGRPGLWAIKLQEVEEGKYNYRCVAVCALHWWPKKSRSFILLSNNRFHFPPKSYKY